MFLLIFSMLLFLYALLFLVVAVLFVTPPPPPFPSLVFRCTTNALVTYSLQSVTEFQPFELIYFTSKS